MDQIDVKNLVPNFLEFYHNAKDETDSDKRWELWKKHYHFAAVPPGNEGQQIARDLLDEAWTKYDQVMDDLKNWAPDKALIERYLPEIKSLLGYRSPVDITVVYFVGNFEGNAFVAPTEDGGLAVCLPVEMAVSEITLAHELTHIIHAKKAELSGQAERYIASLIMEEGLATRVSQLMVPGAPDGDYVEMESGWLEQCEQRGMQIFNGMLPYLNKSDMDTVNKFTFGNGTTGRAREAYYVGWKLIGYLMESGVGLDKLAGLSEDEMVPFIEETMQDYVEDRARG